jgi:hypothetical protein
LRELLPANMAIGIRDIFLEWHPACKGQLCGLMVFPATVDLGAGIFGAILFIGAIGNCRVCQQFALASEKSQW